MNELRAHTHWITLSGQESPTGNTELRFPYWSFTKTAMSICALKLVEAGALDLDECLENQPYSLRQLLGHTSGLSDYGQLEQYHAAVKAKELPWSKEMLLDMVLEKGLLFEPGQGWSYSNTGYIIVREVIEKAALKPMGELISEMICEPLRLASIELSETRQQFAQLHWEAASDYDPRWVYPGCLTGTAADASRLLHGLFAGNLLKPDSREQMLVRRSLGGAILDRPWEQCGYALGLMSGTMKGAGTAIGHSGGGPFCVNAIYHFTDVPDPITIACFTDGRNEGAAEFAAANIVG